MTDYFLMGINDVSAERLRQITEEGHNSEKDDTYLSGTLASAGASYALAAVTQLIYGQDSVKEVSRTPDMWPWPTNTWNPQEPRKNLVRAAALIIAEIDRIDRQEKIAKISTPIEANGNVQVESEKLEEKSVAEDSQTSSNS